MNQLKGFFFKYQILLTAVINLICLRLGQALFQSYVRNYGHQPPTSVLHDFLVTSRFTACCSIAALLQHCTSLCVIIYCSMTLYKFRYHKSSSWGHDRYYAIIHFGSLHQCQSTSQVTLLSVYVHKPGMTAVISPDLTSHTWCLSSRSPHS